MELQGIFRLSQNGVVSGTAIYRKYINLLNMNNPRTVVLSISGVYIPWIYCSRMTSTLATFDGEHEPNEILVTMNNKTELRNILIIFIFLRMYSTVVRYTHFCLFVFVVVILLFFVFHQGLRICAWACHVFNLWTDKYQNAGRIPEVISDLLQLLMV